MVHTRASRVGDQIQVEIASLLTKEVHDPGIGFLTITRPSTATAQISWLAVQADERGRGVGTALIERLVEDLSHEPVRLLVVETLSDREDPGPEYAATRAFYLARGFSPAAELQGYPDNPIQLLAKPIG